MWSIVSKLFISFYDLELGRIVVVVNLIFYASIFKPHVLEPHGWSQEWLINFDNAKIIGVFSGSLLDSTENGSGVSIW